jgi:hypothetical protein
MIETTDDLLEVGVVLDVKGVTIDIRSLCCLKMDEIITLILGT